MLEILGLVLTIKLLDFEKENSKISYIVLIIC
jgi:hypothetical protein